MSSNRSRFPILALAALALWVTAGCGDTFDARATPTITIQPSTVLFDGVPEGNVNSQSFTISNQGLGSLTIKDMVVNGSAFTITGATRGDSQVNPSSFQLSPNESAVITVEYLAGAGAVSNGSIAIEHNDPARDGVSNVPLVVRQTGGRLFVTPNPVTFGRVPAGGEGTVTTTMTNIGTAAITVSGYFLVGATEFAIVDEDVFTENFTLAPDESRAVTLRFTPIDNDEASASLLVRTIEGSETANIEVPVSGNGAQPCIEVTPGGFDGAYDFGERLLDVTAREFFTITNCSSAGNGEPLVVTSIGLGPDSSAAFALDAVPAVPLTLAPGDSSQFLVDFTPTVDQQSEVGVLLLTSNDAASEEIAIDLYGVGTNNVPPVARAVCTVEGAGGPGLSELFVLPLNNVTCSGADSNDPDGEIREYIWTVVDRPDDSTAEFTPASAMNTRFFVDLTGRFTFELVVVDDRGASSEPAQVVLVARPDEDIHLQLTWHTPEDTNENDSSGSDFDLHFLHPNGCWKDLQYDCHYNSPEPNWGSTTDNSDDPSLDRDDVDGAGPENINLDNPQQGTTYLVAVQYYDDHDFGPAYANVRIYVHGELLFEARDKLMVNNGSGGGQWWVVASLDWPSSVVTPIDRLFEDVPSCPL